MSYPGTPAVAFNYGGWVARYPEFAGVLQERAQLFFNEATLYCANRLNPVEDLTTLTTLLNMLTAHVAAMAVGPNGKPSPSNQPPGRVTNATEGSVSVTFENQYPPGSPQWFQQTRYGAAYWQATAVYRTMRYRTVPPSGQTLSQIPWLYPNGNGST